MSLGLTGEERSELKSLLERSIGEISSEIRRSSSQAVKDDLKRKKESLLSILDHINSSSNKKAA